MADKQYPVHYANFVLHFGEAELLDYLREIVIPAFLSGGKRSYSDTTYFLDSVRLLNFAKPSEAPQLAICGRHVKDMVLRSEQRYDPSSGKLRPDNQTMQTAPSAVFVLLLNSHKLIYMHETSLAPGMESFGSTAASMLRAARRDYIDKVAAREKSESLTQADLARFGGQLDGGKRRVLTKTALYELLPPPVLDVVPLANGDTLRAFIKRFETLQQASVRLIKPNNETDNDGFFEALRKKADDAGAAASSLTYRNKEGLKPNKVASQLEAAASGGNAEIKLEGKDASGQKLSGSNDEFKVTTYLEDKPAGIEALALRLLGLFANQVNVGIIKAPDNEIGPAAQEQLAAAMQGATLVDGNP